MKDMIRNFKILRKIGNGGMGEVYLADDVNLGRKCAIKVLSPQAANDPDMFERFKNECKIQAALVHKNIVSTYTSFDEDGTYYMVMEYAEGITLSELLQTEGKLNEKDAFDIFQQLLDGIGYAHSRGIVHRDLKPSNIIINRNNGLVKILDFGIAKVLGVDGPTLTGTHLGTGSYMSPEQISTPRMVDNKTDLYTLGVLLFEMLTGTRPFKSQYDSLNGLMNSIVNDPFPDPVKINPEISKTAAGVIIKLVEKKPVDRPQTCYQVEMMIRNRVPEFVQNDDTPFNFDDYECVVIDANKKENKIARQIISKISDWRYGLALAVFAIICLVIVGYAYYSKDISNAVDNELWPIFTGRPRIAMIFIPSSRSKYDRNTEVVSHIPKAGYYIAKYEVTQKLWNSVMGDNSSRWKGDNMPVENVSWNDAQVFIGKLNQLTGGKYRLPTVWEWEFAAEKITKKNKDDYPFAYDYQGIAWDNGYVGPSTRPVGQKEANDIGLYDMIGNVREWCDTTGFTRTGFPARGGSCLDWYGSGYEISVDYYANNLDCRNGLRLAMDAQ